MLSSFIKNLDGKLVFPSLIIFSLGALSLFSIDLRLLESQLFFLILAIFTFLIFANLDLKIFPHFDWHFYIFSLFSLLLTFILGTLTRGSMRWIRIGSLNLQPSELVKPLLIVSFASFALKMDFKNLKNILFFIFLLLLPVLLIFKQPDLGSALVVLVFGFSIMLAKGIKKTYFILGAILLLLLLPLSWQILKPYQRQRITSFLNPQDDPLGSGYHLIQAQIAVGSGIFWGRGLGRGSQSQLEFLPERHSDFIFASLAEELGFMGSSILLLAFLLLLYKIFKISQQAQFEFSQLVCLGGAMLLFFQFFVNVGMNLGLMPITGITLPLVSYGGSSLLSTSILLGLIQSAAKNLKRDSMIEIK